MSFPLMLVLLFSGTCVFAQVKRSPIQLSGYFPTYSKKVTSLLSINANATTVLHAKSLSAIVYKEQKFLLKEIGVLCGIVVMPVSEAAVAMAVQHSGNSSYRETNLSVIYCKPLGKADVAAKFMYMHTLISGLKPERLMSIAIAGMFHLNDQFNSGFQIQHLNSVFAASTRKNVLHPEYRLGFGYDVSPIFHLAIEYGVQQTETGNVTVGAGYQVHERCRLFIGLETLTPAPSLGVEFSAEAWNIGMKTSYHGQLGITPALWVSFCKRKTN